jgi:hypothetical protein
MIKRQMYGRAKLDLLRKRILTHNEDHLLSITKLVPEPDPGDR